MPGVRRVVLSLVLISVLLAGQALPMVSAVYATLYEFTYSQDLEADTNGHTYLYVPEPESFFVTSSGLFHDSDMDYDSYDMTYTSWSHSTGSLSGIGEEMDMIQPTMITLPGWLANASLLPSFHDFANSTNDYRLSINDRHTYFGVPFGQVTSVVLDPKSNFYGTFNVTTQEFFHLTVTSREDNTELGVIVMDESGLMLNYIELAGGDIDVVPFAPNGPGMYIIGIFLGTVGPGLTIVDLLLEEVQPDTLVPGEIVEGVLPGSELVVKTEGGDTVHQEKAPAAHTFKFTSPNSTYPGRLRWATNHPELDDDIYTPFETRFHVTTDILVSSYPTKFIDYLNSAGDTYYYQSFQGETYYLTILGMEETTYSLVNEIPSVPVLPLEMPIYLESYMTSNGQFAYRLPLSTDSILKLNTSSTGAFDWMVFTAFDNNVYRGLTIPESTTFHGAQPIYLPAGDYLVVGYGESVGDAAVTTFTLGPVLDDVSHVSVYNGDVVGVRVPTEALTFYNFNVTLETHDNVSVDCDIDIFNHYGTLIYGTNALLGNQQSGLGWVEVGINRTMITLGLPSGYDMFGDGFGIVSLSPYQVRNNTAGLTSRPDPYIVDYSLTQEDYANMIFNGTESWSQTSPGWTNFTLGEPGDDYEYYVIEATCTPGTWFNVTYLAEDMEFLEDIFIYQRYNGFTQKLDFDDLDDTHTGTTSRAEFEFGSISRDVLIIFYVDRDTKLEGSLDVIITPYSMNTYRYPPTPRYVSPSSVGDGAAVDLGSVAVGAGVAGVAVLVVVIIFVARKKGKI